MESLAKVMLQKTQSRAMEDIIQASQFILEQLPQVIFFKNSEHEFIGCNNRFIRFAEFNKQEELLWKKDEDMPWAEESPFYYKMDNLVLTGETTRLIMPVALHNNKKVVVSQRKTPLRNPEKEIVGIAVTLDVINNVETLNSVLSVDQTDLERFALTGLYSNKYQIKETYDPMLTKRESECLFYILRGKTAKEIAKILTISHKTVENHIEKIKIKFLCTTKGHVIDKMISLGYINIIPESVHLRRINNVIKDY